ncbi:MAG: TlpA disulfide reductase family protein [Bryobacteraceae bacterium]|jgi:peroxiredoxin
MRIILAVLLCTGALLAAADNPGRRAPGFALPDSKMQVFDLADYRGKIVLLEFMQTTCGHCAPFADVLERLQQKYGDQVAILAVVNSRGDDQNSVARFISGHRITYPILFDAGQMAYSYLRSMRFDTPHVFLIDAGGTIRNDWEYGLVTRDIFEGNGLMSEIDSLLSGKAAPQKKK